MSLSYKRSGFKWNKRTADMQVRISSPEGAAEHSCWRPSVACRIGIVSDRRSRFLLALQGFSFGCRVCAERIQCLLLRNGFSRKASNASRHNSTTQKCTASQSRPQAYLRISFTYSTSVRDRQQYALKSAYINPRYCTASTSRGEHYRSATRSETNLSQCKA